MVAEWNKSVSTCCCKVNIVHSIGVMIQVKWSLPGTSYQGEKVLGEGQILVGRGLYAS